MLLFFKASFQFLNECAQYFCDVKDKDIKHTLAGLFVEILVPITGQVKNEVNIPCLKSFVDILYTHALELSAKSKHRLATIPLLTCLLCVSQRQFFLNSWFQFAQLCIQQFKSKEPMLARISLEAVLRLVWVYTIRIKCEKSSDTNQRLLAITQNLFPKGSKVCQPKEMPPSVFVKIIGYIAYEKLDFAMKEIIYDLLSIDLNSSYSANSDQATMMNACGQLITNNTGLLTTTSSNAPPHSLTNSHAFRISRDNLILQPVRMEIGLRAFILIADTLQQQKELGQAQPPSMPPTFNIPAHDTLSVYLSNASNSTTSSSSRPNSRTSSFNDQLSGASLTHTSSVILTDMWARELGLGVYFEHVRRSFQDILKTLDCTIGKPFLLTRPDNLPSSSAADSSAETIAQSVSTTNLASGASGQVSAAVNSNPVGADGKSAVGNGSTSTANSATGKTFLSFSSITFMR
jgi:hypothetical protein